MGLMVWKPLRAFAPLSVALALSGCFDVDQKLTINGSGAGSLEVRLRTDPSLKGGFETETIIGPQAAPVEVTREVKDGQYIQRERVSFNSLADLRVRNETLSITNEGTTFFGLGPKKLVLRRIVDNGGNDPDSYGLVKSAFQDRVYTFAVTLPGWVQKAYPVIANGQAIAPIVDGATVKWQIPMALAIASGALDYRVDFRSYMDIKANITAQRIDGALGNFPGLPGGH